MEFVNRFRLRNVRFCLRPWVVNEALLFPVGSQHRKLASADLVVDKFSVDEVSEVRRVIGQVELESQSAKVLSVNRNLVILPM